MINDLGLPANFYDYVLGSNGTVVAHSDESKIGEALSQDVLAKQEMDHVGEDLMPVVNQRRQENSLSFQKLSESMQETLYQIAVMQEMLANIERLNNIAQELKKAVSRFKL